MSRSNHTFVRGEAHRSAPRFFVPSSIARAALGNHRLMRLPTEALVDELSFGFKHLHKSGTRNFVCAGDAESYLVPVAQKVADGEARQLLAADLEFRSTKAYAHRIRMVENGDVQLFHRRNMRSRDDVDAYFNYMCELIRSMKQHGCVSRYDTSRDVSSAVPEFSPDKGQEFDIGIAIGPAGQTWMFWTGHHRLQIARMLGIEEIPVEVHLVHWQWLKRCIGRHGWMPVRAIASGLEQVRRGSLLSRQLI